MVTGEFAAWMYKREWLNDSETNLATDRCPRVGGSLGTCS